MSHVFDLIKSMTKPEKRHFKTMNPPTKGGRVSKAVQLFDDLNKMKVYDEEKLKKKGFEKSLRRVEQLLLEGLLKSLRRFNTTSSTKIILTELLNNFDILYKKGFYDLAESNIERAISIAQRLDDHAILLKINSQKRLLFRERRGRKYHKEMTGLLEENKRIKEYLNEEQGYLDAYDTLMLRIANKSRIKSKTDIEELLSSIDKSLLDEDRSPYSNLSKLYYSKCNALFNQLLGKSDLAKKYYTDALNWWEDNEDYKKQNFHQYIMSLSNMIQACHSPEYYYDDVPQLFDKIETSKPITTHEKRIRIEAIYLNKSSYLMNTDPLIKGKEFQKAIELAKEIEENIHSYNINEDFYITIYLNNVLLFFLLEDFNECIRWLSKIQPSIIGLKSKAKENLQLCAWRILLICYHELEDEDNFESNLRKARNKQRSFNIGKESFEYKMTNLLKKLNHNTPKRIEILNDINTLLKEVAPKPSGFDVTSFWVDSRLANKTIIQLLRDRNNKKD